MSKDNINHNIILYIYIYTHIYIKHLNSEMTSELLEQNRSALRVYLQSIKDIKNKLRINLSLKIRIILAFLILLPNMAETIYKYNFYIIYIHK